MFAAVTTHVSLASRTACAMRSSRSPRGRPSTLVAGQKSARATVRYAAAWGAGHAAMLIVAGGALALLRKELPSLASDIFGLVVALVLMGLGVRGLGTRAWQTPDSPSRIVMVTSSTAHAGVADHVHVGGWTLARLPFVVGLVHGLAGSGALAALVASRVPSAAFAISFITIYAIGAAVGMSALAGVLGWPLARVSLGRAER